MAGGTGLSSLRRAGMWLHWNRRWTWCRHILNTYSDEAQVSEKREKRASRLGPWWLETQLDPAGATWTINYSATMGSNHSAPSTIENDKSGCQPN
jgi:hypothetical protein